MLCKVHVSESSSIPDHCRQYALSDAKSADYQGNCDHTHDGVCDRCNRLEHSIHKIEEALNLVTTSEEEFDELTFSTEQAKHSIVTWKAHLLRSVNQDDARVNTIDNLNEDSFMLEQDWAMKYLPRKYRESQRDWFAKRGIPWHITVATRRSSAGQLETMTFVHIFQSCSQDGSTVLAIMGDVLGKLKEAIASLKSVFCRSDNVL